MLDVLSQIWERSTGTQAPLSLTITTVLALVALVLVGSPSTYRIARHGITVVHEAGHAVVALMVGRKLAGIRVHSDTSGLTVSSGKPRGPGMVATLIAGYPAPAVFGLVAAYLLSQGYAVGLLWFLVLAAIVMTLAIRNVYGGLTMLAITIPLAWASWSLPATTLSWLAYLLTFLLLLGAPRAVLDMAAIGKRGHQAGSDPGQLARLTHTVPGLWVGLFLLISCGCAALGVFLLVSAA